LPKDIVNDKQGFLDKLEILNQIRNRVMHPSKGYDFKAKDFDLIYKFHAAISIDNWQDKEFAK
jgi:SET domain-containing protein